MTAESDKLDGLESITLILSGGTRVTLTDSALRCKDTFRSAVERQTGFPVPEYTDAEFDDVITALLILTTADDLAPAA